MAKHSLLISVIVILSILSGGCAGPEPTVAPTPTDVVPEPTLEPTPTPPPGLGDVWARPADGATMVYVPRGTFPMGSTEAEVDEAFAEFEAASEDLLAVAAAEGGDVDGLEAALDELEQELRSSMKAGEPVEFAAEFASDFLSSWFSAISD